MPYKYTKQLSGTSTQEVAGLVARGFVRLSSHHHGALVIDGPSAVDETVYLLCRKRRGVPAVRERRRDDVDVGQQQVRRQVGLRSSHPEQVAVVGHQLMLDQVRRENCWKS